jgi:hypothetical protein
MFQSTKTGIFIKPVGVDGVGIVEEFFALLLENGVVIWKVFSGNLHQGTDVVSHVPAGLGECIFHRGAGAVEFGHLPTEELYALPVKTLRRGLIDVDRPVKNDPGIIGIIDVAMKEDVGPLHQGSGKEIGIANREVIGQYVDDGMVFHEGLVGAKNGQLGDYFITIRKGDQVHPVGGNIGTDVLDADDFSAVVKCAPRIGDDLFVIHGRRLRVPGPKCRPK